MKQKIDENGFKCMTKTLVVQVEAFIKLIKDICYFL